MKTKEKNPKENELEQDIRGISNVKPKEKDIEHLEVTDGMDVKLENMTFRKIVRNIKRGKIIVDKDFQRDEVYKIPQKSALINSAILGKAIPPLYAFEYKLPDGRYVLSIIDGQQRLSAVRDFMTNKYALKIPYGDLSILNGYTYEQIKRINPTFADEISDLTLDINIIRNITKEEAQEYFGLINTTSMPLSPGEKLWSLHDPTKTVLTEIVNNPYFKISNLRKSRKGEYLLATKLLWNQMFLQPSKHEFIGNSTQTFVDYFNTTDNFELIEVARDNVIELIKLYSEIVNNCQFSPRTQGDFYSTICFLDIQKAKRKVNVEKLSKFLNWIFKGINKKIYPITLSEPFEELCGNRVSNGKHVNCKQFVILLEQLYREEESVWSM